MKKGLWMVAMLTLWYSGANAVELPSTTTIPDCIQDQFGNQYDRLGFDLPNRIVTGIVHATQCGADWPMIGSWDNDAAGQIILELSVANTPKVVDVWTCTSYGGVSSSHLELHQRVWRPAF
jgi:hypothetical protein